MLLAVDHEGRGRGDFVGLGVFLEQRIERLGLVGVLQAGIERLVREPGTAADLLERVDHVGGFALGPLALLVVDHVGDPEVADGPTATRDHAGPEARTIKVDLPVDELHLAGVDVVFLEVLKGRLVEPLAVRAGVGGVLDDGDRRVLRPEGHLDDAGRVDLLGALGIRGTQGGQVGLADLLRSEDIGAHSADGGGGEGDQGEALEVHVGLREDTGFARIWVPRRLRARCSSVLSMSVVSALAWGATSEGSLREVSGAASNCA